MSDFGFPFAALRIHQPFKPQKFFKHMVNRRLFVFALALISLPAQVFARKHLRIEKSAAARNRIKHDCPHNADGAHRVQHVGILNNMSVLVKFLHAA